MPEDRRLNIGVEDYREGRGSSSRKRKRELPPQPSIFDAPPAAEERPRARMPVEVAEMPPHQKSSPTSRASAEALKPSSLSKMFLIYSHIEQKGAYGATRQEIADDLGISLQTVCGQVRRIYQMGRIGSNPGHTRANRWSGRENEVMLHERYVERWQNDQTRPALPFCWEAR